MAIVNGIGYDEWASQLLAAIPEPARVLDVGDLLGYTPGDNPHQWYSPGPRPGGDRTIVADYDKLARPTRTTSPSGTHFETEDFAGYDALLVQISARYAGVPVGYSESIFQPLGEALGLELLTPYSFAKAIARAPR